MLVVQLWSRYWIVRCLLETGLLASVFYMLSSPAYDSIRPAFADEPLRAYRAAVHDTVKHIEDLADQGPVTAIAAQIERLRRQYIDNRLKLDLNR